MEVRRQTNFPSIFHFLVLISNPMRQFFFYLGTAAALILPLLNIPLILKIRRNKSAKDLSLIWVIGVEIGIILMLPQAILSTDWTYKIFGIVNFVLFTAVVFFVLHYKRRP